MAKNGKKNGALPPSLSLLRKKDKENGALPPILSL